MIGSDTANFCIRAAMGALVLGGGVSVWVLIGLQAVGGVATAFSSPASSGLVPHTVPAGLLQQANGLMAVARYLAFPLGAAAGGTVVATVGAGWALIVDAGTYAASALLLARMRLPDAGAAHAPNFVRALAEGWEAFTEHTWLWLLTAWISLYFLITYAPFFVLGPYVAKASMGGASAWTVVVTGEGIGALAGGILGLRVRPRRSLLVIGCLFPVTALQSILLAEGAPFEAIAGAAAMAGFAFSYGSVVFETSVQERVAPEKLSRVAAYNWMGAMAFLPAGYALAGPIAAAVGLEAYLWFGAAWIVCTTAAVLCVRDVRRFRAPEPLPAGAG
jgi:predicted MFS family arabinose efflux permease